MPGSGAWTGCLVRVVPVAAVKLNVQAPSVKPVTKRVSEPAPVRLVAPVLMPGAQPTDESELISKFDVTTQTRLAELKQPLFVPSGFQIALILVLSLDNANSKPISANADPAGPLHLEF